MLLSFIGPPATTVPLEAVDEELLGNGIVEPENAIRLPPAGDELMRFLATLVNHHVSDSHGIGDAVG